jgi:hypothetical protein
MASTETSGTEAMMAPTRALRLAASETATTRTLVRMTLKVA